MGVETTQYDCKSQATPVSLHTNCAANNFTESPRAPGDPIMKSGIGAEKRDLENRPLGKTQKPPIVQEGAIGDDDNAQAFVNQVAGDFGKIIPEERLPPR